jgi:Erv1 / Alr family
MPCGCGKKKSGTVHFMGKEGPPDSEDWGPILWKYLHCLAEKLGISGNQIIDTDQANHMENILHNLHLILPCTDCQAHAVQYISTNPLPTLRGLVGPTLQTTVRNWLFQFHNSVRSQKGQPILLHSVDECTAQYADCFVPNCEYTLFVQSVAYAVRQGWVRIDNWRKWYSHSERLRIICGNMVR